MLVFHSVLILNGVLSAFVFRALTLGGERVKLTSGKDTEEVSLRTGGKDEKDATKLGDCHR